MKICVSLLLSAVVLSACASSRLYTEPTDTKTATIEFSSQMAAEVSNNPSCDDTRYVPADKKIKFAADVPVNLHLFFKWRVEGVAWKACRMSLRFTPEAGAEYTPVIAREMKTFTYDSGLQSECVLELKKFDTVLQRWNTIPFQKACKAE